jgi:hypothetical protein
MAQVDITIQAATDAALTTMLMAHGVLVAGEGGVRPAPGILHSHIGDAVLDGVALAGRYAFVGIDREAFGGPATDQLLIDLAPHRYSGPAVRARLGGAGYAPDTVSAIKAERDRRIQTSGYKVGAHWFHSDLTSRTQQLGLVIMGAAIPAGLKWKTMGGTLVDMTPALAAQVFQSAAAQDAAHFAVAEAAIAAANASPSFDLASIQWPAGYEA